MDADERMVLNLLAEAWNAFVELQPLHEWDRVEFMHAIHQAQNIVMARPLIRATAAQPRAVQGKE